jgi:hypothetical protein
MTMSGNLQRVSSSALRAASVGPTPTDDDAIDGLEFDDPTIDEIELPELDTDDAEALGHEQNYDDLIDRRWLERTADDAELDDDRDALRDIGLTIELDGPNVDDDGAQVLDLDVGSLLTPLPGDGTELDLEPFGQERGDTGTGIGVLRGMLLPDSEEGGHDDREVGDDDRFPVFDDASHIAPRPSLDDDDPAHGDELS